MFSADPLVSSADYRRRARRIRASFAGNSFLTQSALRDLARKRDLEVDRAGEMDRRSEPVARRSASSEYLRAGLAGDAPSPLQLQITAVVERGFAELALTKLQPFGFTFSDRAALLDAGEKLGISRFRANLILAMQENGVLQRRSVLPVQKPAGNTPWLLLTLSLEILAVALLAWWVMR